MATQNNDRGAEIFLVRHGETEWSRAGKHTGVTDLSLTEEGRRAAAALGARLAARPFQLVLSSPRARARETCVLAGLGERMEVVDDLAEWRYGDYEGKTTAEIRRTVPDWTVWRHGCPGGEAAADVGRRADRVIERLRAAAIDAVVFSHAHFLRALAARWIGLPPEQGEHLYLETGSISVVGSERESASIRLWNDPAVRPVAAEASPRARASRG